MTLRRAALTQNMAEVAAALHQASGLPEHWDAPAFGELLAMPGAGGELALSGDDPIGLILWRVAADEAEILTICVQADERRRGAGRFLLTGAITAVTGVGVRRLYLEVAEDNVAAIALYHGFGLRPQGRRPGYYHTSNGRVDALIFAKDL